MQVYHKLLSAHLINEFFQDALEGHEHSLGSLSGRTKEALARYWLESGQGKSDSILYKYSMARILANMPAQRSDTNPHQAVKLLIELRNWCVHYRPDTVSDDDPHRLDAKLRGKFPDCALMENSGNPWFPDIALGAGCARWAFDSAKAFGDEFCGAFSIQPNYQLVDHPTQRPPKPPAHRV